MADKSIGELTKASTINNDDLLLLEQNGTAMSLLASVLRAYAEQAGRDAAGEASKGATFKPKVSSTGVLSWTNDQGLTNPASVNLGDVIGAALAAEHEIKTYKSLPSIGVGTLSNTDVVANFRTIFNALPVRSLLWLHASNDGNPSTVDTNPNLAQSIINKLTADVGVKNTFLDLFFERIGNLTMVVKVVPQIYNPSNEIASGCLKEYTCVYRMNIGTTGTADAPETEYLSPFVQTRDPLGFYGPNNKPNASELITDLAAAVNGTAPKDTDYFVSQKVGGNEGDTPDNTYYRRPMLDLWKYIKTKIAPSEIGAVPDSRMVNGRALSSDISLTASDVKAVNPNLLHNAVFDAPENIINQKGLPLDASVAGTGYSSIDRWHNNYNNIVTIESDCVKWTNNVASGASSFAQRIETVLPAGVYTASVVVKSISGGSPTMYFYATTEDSETEIEVKKATLNVGLNEFTFTLRKSAKASRIHIRILNGQSISLRAIKLERGPSQTLAYQDSEGNWILTEPPADRTAELLKCKRYFERIKASGTNLTLGVGTAGSSTLLYVTLPISPKRVKPSADALTACVSNLRYGTNKLTDTPTAAKIFSIDLDSGFCTLEVTGAFISGTAYRLGLAAGGYLDFDSNL